MTSLAASPLVRLVRLPSVITVPGDVLAGAAWAPADPAGSAGAAAARGATAPVAAARVASSSLTYLAGMALNDWADRQEDAVERPTRPIPAGEIGAGTALAVAVALSAGALALAAAGDRRGRGRGSLAITAPLLATVWAYDVKAKQTPTGPWTMALARALDVLVGARGPRRDALAPAGLIGAHTLLITLVSREEARGASRRLAAGALGGVAVTTVAATALVSRAHPRGARASRGLRLASIAVYASVMSRAGIGALRDGDAASAQRFVGAGVFANMPLQAALLAARGRTLQAATVLGAWQFGRGLGRRVAIT
ncbi:MAG TPA: UbiA family prenyltransferase [Solirubrobacteraceae bacterium]|nr:UbiA family prenyltransferase [Solirubrobacteraceae bacterium]